MRISIVMPTYNGMRYLQQAVDSVLSQHYQDWQLIISDDGSTDGTRDYLSSIKDPRVKIHFQPKNLNIFGNLNYLFSHAEGDITQILCQDDYFLSSDSLDTLFNLWSSQPAEIAYLRCNHAVSPSSSLERFEVNVLPSLVKPDQSNLMFYIFGCIPGNLSNVSVRKGVVQNAGWFRTDLPYAGDFEFWSRVGGLYPWAISSTGVTHIRSHDLQASKTLNRRGELMAQIRVVVDGLYQKLVKQGYSPTRLRLIMTLSTVSQCRYIGVKEALRGKGSVYLHEVSTTFDTADFSFGPLLAWPLFFVGLGGRMFKIAAAKHLLKQKPHEA